MDEIKDKIHILAEYVTLVQADKIKELNSNEFQKDLDELVSWMKNEGYDVTAESILLGWSTVEVLYYARTQLEEILQWQLKRQKMCDNLEERFKKQAENPT